MDRDIISHMHTCSLHDDIHIKYMRVDFNKLLRRQIYEFSLNYSAVSLFRNIEQDSNRIAFLPFLLFFLLLWLNGQPYIRLYFII